MDTIITCPGCKGVINIDNLDLIKIGRQQVTGEIEKILERLRK